MTIQLTKATYVSGVLAAAGSQHTLDAQTESYLVHIGAATWVDAAYTQGRFEDAKIEYDSDGVAVGIVGRANEVVGPVWQTDASGNVVGLVGPGGKLLLSARQQQNMTTEPLVATGTYTGAGLINVAFNPDAVIVVPATNVQVYFKHRACWKNNSPGIGAASAHNGNVITEIHENTFTIGASAGASGYWIALADNGSGKVRAGSYAGNGVDNRVVDCGLEPVFVMVKRDNTYPCWMRATGITTSYPLSAAAASANNIKSFTATGFTVGTSADINAASDSAGSGGEAYDYLALAASPAWTVFQFVGNAAQRDLTPYAGVTAALLKSHDSGTPRVARIAVNGMAGDKPVTGTAETTGVMAISGGTLSVGASDESNGSNIVHTVVAFREFSDVIEIAENVVERQALQLGAGGGVICATNNSAFNLVSPSPISLELYFKPNGLPPSDYYLISRGQSSAAGNIQYAMFLSNSGSLNAVFSLGGGTQKVLEYGLTFFESKAYHIILSFDGEDDVTIWVDGRRLKAAFSTTVVGEVATEANAKFAIGCLRNTSDATMLNCVGYAFALARLYNIALTDDEAFARYRRVVIGDSGAKDVVPLDEWDAANIVGSTWYAALSATNNGTIVGAANTLVNI